VRALRERFGVVTGTLSEGDMLAAMAEDLLVQPFAGKQRVALHWPGDALHEDAFEEALRRLEPHALRAVKAVSVGWRAAVRRVLCSPRYQAEYCTVEGLLSSTTSVVRPDRLEGLRALFAARPAALSEPCCGMLPIEHALSVAHCLHKGPLARKDGVVLAATLLDVDPDAPHTAEASLNAQWKAVLGCGVLRPARGFRPSGLQDADVDPERTVATLQTLLKLRSKGGYARDAEAATELVSTLLAHIDAKPVPDGLDRGLRDAVEKALRKHVAEAAATGGAASDSGSSAAKKRKR
jgi:hypothetical protein